MAKSPGVRKRDGSGAAAGKGARLSTKRAGLYLPEEWWAFLVDESARRKRSGARGSDYTSIVVDGMAKVRAAGGSRVRRETKDPQAWRSSRRVGLYLPRDWWAFLVAEAARRKGEERPDHDYSSIVVDGLSLLKRRAG